MNDLDSFRARWSPRVLSILRIVVGFLFMAHGSQKMFGFPMAAHGPFNPATLMGFGAILEFFGGLFVLLGLLTRPVAFLLCGEMAVAYFMVHAKQGFWPLVNKGELAVLYCFVFLYFVFAGGGIWSLDYLISRNRSRR
jgi:putative oxidoreductase